MGGFYFVIEIGVSIFLVVGFEFRIVGVGGYLRFYRVYGGFFG